MAQFKYTMIFDYFSGIDATNTVPIRIGGWTESYYAAAADDATHTAFRSLIQVRLGICPRGTSISKYRVQQVDPTLASTLKKVSFAAPLTWLSDVPQMALKVKFDQSPATGAMLREFRGLPDSQVVTGEYTPSNPFTLALFIFTGALSGGLFKCRRRDRSLPKSSILSISAAGVVVMIDPVVGVAVGSQIQVIRTVNPMTGRKHGYFAKVSAVTDDSHFVISGPKVVASGFGEMRMSGIFYQQFLLPDSSNAQAVVRKVGRPLRSYSGRASKRA